MKHLAAIAAMLVLAVPLSWWIAGILKPEPDICDYLPTHGEELWSYRVCKGTVYVVTPLHPGTHVWRRAGDVSKLNDKYLADEIQAAEAMYRNAESCNCKPLSSGSKLGWQRRAEELAADYNKGRVYMLQLADELPKMQTDPYRFYDQDSAAAFAARSWRGWMSSGGR